MSIIKPSEMSGYVLQTMRDCVAKEFSELTKEEQELKTAELLNLAGNLRMVGEPPIEQIRAARIRMMQEAYDFADKGDFESYDAIKVMTSDILALIEEAVKAEREATLQLCKELEESEAAPWQIIEAIQARSGGDCTPLGIS